MPTGRSTTVLHVVPLVVPNRSRRPPKMAAGGDAKSGAETPDGRSEGEDDDDETPATRKVFMRPCIWDYYLQG